MPSSKAKPKPKRDPDNPASRGKPSRTTIAKRMTALGYEHVSGWLDAADAAAVKRQIAATADAKTGAAAPARRRRTMADRIARTDGPA